MLPSCAPPQHQILSTTALPTTILPTTALPTTGPPPPT